VGEELVLIHFKLLSWNLLTANYQPERLSQHADKEFWSDSASNAFLGSSLLPQAPFHRSIILIKAGNRYTFR
jgi:hypothetical protein